MLDVARPLERQLLVGTCPDPFRDDELDGFVVEVVAGVGQCGHFLPRRVIQFVRIANGRAADALMDVFHELPLGDVAHVAYPGCLEPASQVTCIGEHGDRIFGLGQGAVIEEGAFVRRRALLARDNRRHRTGEHLPERLDPERHLLHQGQDVVGHVVVGQQPLVVAVTRVNETVVHMGEFDPLERVAGAIHHPGLNCAVLQVVRLDRGG